MVGGDSQTHRLRGSGVFRDFALAIGSNDFTTSSGTGVASELADSSSFRSPAGDLDAASSLALRRKQTLWERAEGRIARGNDLIRYLDGSLAAILVCNRRCRC